MKGYQKLIIKTLLIFSLLLTVYYLFVLVPAKTKSENIKKTQEIVSLHHSNLVQNRLAYIELIKLDPNSPSFTFTKSQLVNQIKNTNTNGQKALAESEKITFKNNISKTYDRLHRETQDFYKEQELVLEKVFSTESFSEGVKILKSKQSIELMTKQTNIILEFQWLAELLKE